MEHAKIAYAAGALAVSLLGGVALGGYTVGGLQLRQPIDIIAQAAVRSQPDEPDEMPIAQGSSEHVCTGCDARPFREDAWYRSEAAYEPEDAVPTEDVSTDQDADAWGTPAVVTIADRED